MSDNVRIAICDDDESTREELISRLERHFPNATVSCFSSGEQFLADYNYYDIVMLDIDMDGVSGVDVARKIRKKQETSGEKKSVIIFITGYRDFMEDAFDVEAYHYLVKPVPEERFCEVVGKAYRNTIQKKNHAEAFLTIRTSDENRRVRIEDIVYVESDRKKVTFHTSDGYFDTYGRIVEMEEKLGAGFYRPHRCYLVNLDRIVSYRADRILLPDDRWVPIAQKKYRDFLKAYAEYLRKN